MNKCTFGFHNWNKWQHTKELWTRGYFIFDKQHDFTLRISTRECRDCGKQQRVTSE